MQEPQIDEPAGPPHSAKRLAWRKIARASAIGSMVGFIGGPVAGWLFVMVAGGGYSGPGAGGLVLLLFAGGAVVGLLVGFAIPLLWCVPKLRIFPVAGA